MVMNAVLFVAIVMVGCISSHGMCSSFQTAWFFVKDQLKSFLLQCLLVPLVTGGLVLVIKWGGAYFYIYAWLFVLLVSLVSADTCNLLHSSCLYMCFCRLLSLSIMTTSLLCLINTLLSLTDSSKQPLKNWLLH